MSPYDVAAEEVVTRFATDDARREILRNWLLHRRALRAYGITNGFQWVDGSFVERKQPQDMDVVTFFIRPAGVGSGGEMAQRVRAQPALFDRRTVKTQRQLDVLFVDLNMSAKSLVATTRYYFGLMSHRRNDLLWKGMLHVDLATGDDDAFALGLIPPPAAPGGAP